MILSRQHLALGATVLLSAVLGSIHAFSVFIPEWENLSGANRGNVSLIYSFALIVLTIAVLFGYRLYGVVSPFYLVFVVGVLASAGLWLSAISNTLWLLYLSYSFLFGAANGMGYGFALQLAGQALPNKRGFAMGLVTAFYAVGATVAPSLFVYLIDVDGNRLALQSMAIAVLVAAIASALMLKASKVRFASEASAAVTTLSSSLKRTRLMLWLSYGTAVTAGLMVLGHVFGIAVWARLGTSTAIWAATLVALGNMIGGFCVSFYADKLTMKLALSILPTLSMLSLLVMVMSGNSSLVVTLLCLSVVGFSYGAIIAVYPVAVAQKFGALASPRIYGQIFTAWGVAGLLGPWVSGLLFDKTQSYTPGLIMAAVLSFVSVVVVRSLKQ